MLARIAVPILLAATLAQAAGPARAGDEMKALVAQKREFACDVKSRDLHLHVVAQTVEDQLLREREGDRRKRAIQMTPVVLQVNPVERFQMEGAVSVDVNAGFGGYSPEKLASIYTEIDRQMRQSLANSDN